MAREYIPTAAYASFNDSKDTIIISSRQPDQYHPDLSFQTIRLSCESHPYTTSYNRYAGFILYGYEENGTVKDDWWLNGKHCKSGYLVIQATDSEGVRRCRQQKEGGGIIHGPVYWNVFGLESDQSKAIGEGFSLQDGNYSWNSGPFNACSDYYHDSRREMSDVVRKNVERVLDDWKKNSQPGKTYAVKKLSLSDSWKIFMNNYEN